MYRLPDNFIPSEHGVQVLQVESPSHIYEVTTLERNGDIKFVISVKPLNKLSNSIYYLLSSPELKLYDIFSEFEDCNIKFGINFCDVENVTINKIVTTPIKNFLESFGALYLFIEYS